MMPIRSGLLALCAAAFLAACQPVAQAPTASEPASSSAAWEHWYVDANGLTKTVTDTTDWQLGRVGGTNGTTLVVDCNGNDPTGYLVTIEQGQASAAASPLMTEPYDIEVYSGGERILVEPRRTEPSSGAYRHVATTDLASALRQGASVVFKFSGAEPHRYTLKGSAKVMDRLNCDPNLL